MIKKEIAVKEINLLKIDFEYLFYVKISSVEKRISTTDDLTLGIDRLVFKRLPVDGRRGSNATE